MRVLLDTNICIYMIKNRPPEVRKHFEQFVPGDIAISSITVAELHYGVETTTSSEQNPPPLEAFLLPLQLSLVDAESALVYGKIRAALERQGAPIGGMDMLIAAQAIAQGFTLVTHNLKEFNRVPSLKYETWVN